MIGILSDCGLDVLPGGVFSPIPRTPAKAKCRTDLSSVRWRVVGVVLAVAAGGAPALQSDQVAVVANAASADSVALAELYCQLRSIPKENVVLLQTTQDYSISQADYESQIRQPLCQALSQRGLAQKIRCLAVMYGVPVLMSAPPASERGLAPVYRVVAARLHARLALDCQLLGTVGREFPSPRTEGLAPVGKLFASSMPEPPTPLPAPEDLSKNFSSLMSVRQRQVAEILDPSKRQIAWRQLMALQQDVHGLTGLIEYVATTQPEGAPAVAELRGQLAKAQAELAEIRKQPPTRETTQAQLDLAERIDGALLLCVQLQQTLKDLEPQDPQSAVDNELALLWWQSYPLARSLPNPLHWQYASKNRLKSPPAPVLMAARIDGPSKADAERALRASVEVEKTGLDGIFYIDAGGGVKVKAQPYEATLLNLHNFVRRKTRLKVVLDEKPEVFPPGSCPDAALYVGWYNLRSYVPAFTWKPGAVGWHIASFEAEDLRNPKSNRWCVKMIQNGVAATLGAVDEPLLGAFPLPSEFFPLLLTGRWTIAECYWRTNPSVSWRITLIADPLYNPFAAHPAASVADLPTGLAP